MLVLDQLQRPLVGLVIGLAMAAWAPFGGSGAAPAEAEPASDGGTGETQTEA